MPGLLAAAIASSLIGGGFSLAGGLAANRANQQAQEYNQYIDLLNYYQRERERREAIDQSDRVRREQQLGSTDAFGTRTYFDPVRGWVTELSPEMAELADMQQAETRQQLTNDLPQRRQILNQNVARQNEENYVAEGLRNEFNNIQREDPNAVRQDIIAAGSHGINRAYDDSLTSIFRNSLRTGASNTGRVVEDVNRSRADQLEQLFLNARLSAQGEVDQRYNNRRAQAGNLYNLFAERAGRMPEVSYQPQNVEGNANAMLGQFANREQQGAAASISARGQRGGEMNFIEPNYAIANTIGAVGANVQAGVNNYTAQKQQQDQNSALLAYLTQNGGINMGNGGVLDLVGNYGVF